MTKSQEDFAFAVDGSFCIKHPIPNESDVAWIALKGVKTIAVVNIWNWLGRRRMPKW